MSSYTERKIILLNTRKQHKESCEQYIQEMVSLARQVDENEEETVSVSRAIHGLNPQLIMTLACLDNPTINSLMEKLPFAYDAIRARDVRIKTTTWLPALYGYSAQRFHFPSRRNPRDTNRNNRATCRICKQYGHSARSCPRQQTIDMAVTDGHFQQQP
ncbi:unnamed protein product [Orchesella dallaii]|uniref:CCHC-type domain-containing protein n=1 Tax=Orchesella dallaii TaxID=48710 RepID=A0ABP1PIJ4_9HEXA